MGIDFITNQLGKWRAMEVLSVTVVRSAVV